MSATRYVPILSALILIPALTAGFSAAPADGVPAAPSRITAATVYQDRAVVTRTVSVNLPAGESTVAFENLSSALTDQSLNASAHGVAGTSILDVGVSMVFSETAPNGSFVPTERLIR